MQEIKKLDLEQYINLKYGTRDFLEDLINKLDNQSYKIKELKNYFES